MHTATQNVLNVMRFILNIKVLLSTPNNRFLSSIWRKANNYLSTRIQRLLYLSVIYHYTSYTMTFKTCKALLFLAFYSFKLFNFFLNLSYKFSVFKELCSNLRLFTRNVDHLFSRFQTKVDGFKRILQEKGNITWQVYKQLSNSLLVKTSLYL